VVKLGQMAETRTSQEARFDVFISHASEDKDEFVRPLAAELTRLGFRVWYDELTLRLGDSLRHAIDGGLATSDYGVVVVSHAFFSKKWPQAELDGLFARETAGRKVILPVWHKISLKEVLQYSPLMAGKLAAPTNNGVGFVAARIFEVIRPNIPLPPISTSGNLAKNRTFSSSHTGGHYQIDLGKRHRYLREHILKINLRQMAEFYGFEKVALLEAYERGEDEFSTQSIKALRDFFFISREYLEDGTSAIFDTVDNVCHADGCAKLINQGFDPYLLCLNEERQKLWAWPVFHKEERGLDRIICADSCGYFASMGEGKTNIMHLIKAIQANGKDQYEIQIQKVDRKMWNQLEKRTFYHKSMYRFHGPDNEAQDCFLTLFEEHKQKPTRW